MLIRAGYQISYDCPMPTPMLMTITLHPSRVPDMRTQGPIVFSPGASPRTYEDRFRQHLHAFRRAGGTDHRFHGLRH